MATCLFSLLFYHNLPKTVRLSNCHLCRSCPWMMDDLSLRFCRSSTRRRYLLRHGIFTLRKVNLKASRRQALAKTSSSPPSTTLKKVHVIHQP